MVKNEEPSALWIAATHAGKLDEIAAETFHGAPDDLARFALALAGQVNGGAGAQRRSDRDDERRVARYAAALRAAHGAPS